LTFDTTLAAGFDGFEGAFPLGAALAGAAFLGAAFFGAALAGAAFLTTAFLAGVFLTGCGAFLADLAAFFAVAMLRSFFGNSYF
jgi:hypothetical protein